MILLTIEIEATIILSMLLLPIFLNSEEYVIFQIKYPILQLFDVFTLII